MIADALTLAASAGGGAILGLFGNWISSSVEKKRLETQAWTQVNQHTTKHQNSGSLDRGEPYEKIYKINLWGGGFTWISKGTRPDRMVAPRYNLHLLCITITYCLCTAICFTLGDIVILSQNPTADPSVWEFGLFRRVIPNNAISVVTFASVGVYMANFLAFIMSAVYTGISPRSTRK